MRSGCIVHGRAIDELNTEGECPECQRGRAATQRNAAYQPEWLRRAQEKGFVKKDFTNS